MHETPVIFVHDLLEAAIALGLTSADVAARLGVDPAVFNRAAADAKNGKNPTVSRKLRENLFGCGFLDRRSPQDTRDTQGRWQAVRERRSRQTSFGRCRRN